MGKRLTKEGAEELLEALLWAHGDSDFQQKVKKFTYDVHGDKVAFLVTLKKVAFEVQGPLLEKWGFEASLKGVAEMQMALQDHTRGKNAEPELRQLAEEVMRTLYGEMYERVIEPAPN